MGGLSHPSFLVKNYRLQLKFLTTSYVSLDRLVCQKVVKCVKRSSRVSGVPEGFQLYKKVVRCVRCARGMSGVSEGLQVCQKVVRCVRRLSRVLVGCQVCQIAIRCVSRSSGR